MHFNSNNNFNNFIFKKYSSNLNPITVKIDEHKIYENFLYFLEPRFIKNKSTLFLALSLFSGGSIQSFRVIFGLPARGQRTWSNARTSSRNNSLILNYKLNKFSKYNKKMYITKTTLLAEYVNLFWQQQFYQEWFAMKKHIKKIPIFKKKTNFIDTHSMANFNVFSVYNNPFKSVKKKK